MSVVLHSFHILLIKEKYVEGCSFFSEVILKFAERFSVCVNVF